MLAPPYWAGMAVARWRFTGGVLSATPAVLLSMYVEAN